MKTVIDYSAGVPRASSVKARGHIGAVRYISPPRQTWMKGKPLKKSEVEDFKRNGLSIAVVWQYGGVENPDSMRGRAGGVEDARRAESKLKEVGLEGLPVFFAVDFDVTLPQWNNTVSNYFRGAISVLGRERVGIYGHSRAIAWAVEDGLIGRAGSRYLGWQTKSWSGGFKSSKAVLYQGIHNVPGPDGIGIDVNEVWSSNWGQIPVKTDRAPARVEQRGVSGVTLKRRKGWSGDPVWLADALRAFGVKTVEDPGWKQWGNGDFKSIWGVMAHHTGSNNTSSSLIRYGHSALKGLLSQIHLKRDGTAVLVGVGVAWHAGAGSWTGLPKNNANYHTIGIEANSDGVTPWPPEMLDAYHRICAAICWVLEVNSDRVIGHKEWGAIQGKWDPGLIDMNDFRRSVQKYIDNPPFIPTKKEVEMTSFDKIGTRYKSRVPGSTWQGRPIDFLINADAHSFITRSNTEKLVEENEDLKLRLSCLERKLDTLISAIEKEAK